MSAARIKIIGAAQALAFISFFCFWLLLNKDKARNYDSLTEFFGVGYFFLQLIVGLHVIGAAWGQIRQEQKE